MKFVLLFVIILEVILINVCSIENVNFMEVFDNDSRVRLRRETSEHEFLIKGLKMRLNSIKQRGGSNYGPDMLKLGEFIRSSMAEIADQSVFHQYAQLKSELPCSVRKIIWGDQLILKNDHYRESLYAATNGMAFDGDRRSVFLWRDGTFDEDAWWTFSSTNGGRTFLIKNHQYDEYLYAAHFSPYDSDRRRVFTWRPGTDDLEYEEWLVEIQSDGNHIKLKNKHFNEHLFASGFTNDSKRRHAFTWRPEGDDSTSSKFLWKIC